MSSKFASLILGVLVLIGGGIYIILNDFSFDAPIQEEPLEDWATYRNEKYNFELSHPKDWKVSATEDIEPKINIYKSGTPPLDHHSNATHVSIFPRGLGTEGVVSESKEIDKNPTGEESQDNIEFYLNDGTPWGLGVFGFSDTPASWNPFGFVWGAAEVKNLDSACIRDDQRIEPESCDIFGGIDVIELYGSVNPQDWANVKEILSTFKFTSTTQSQGNGGEFCAQVITPARNPQTGEERDFPTPCDVPEGWVKL